MHTWILLITSLPTENATARMRAWRSLKASGATVLRDGVYLMPEREDCRITLDAVATDVRDADGTALVVRLEEPSDGNFVAPICWVKFHLPVKDCIRNQQTTY